jgi:Flp pilus assembly pilin Flp
MAEENGFGDHSMTQNHKRLKTGQRGTTSRLVIRLVRDETGVTTTEYVVAAVVLAIAAVAASRLLAGLLVNYLHRIYLVTTLPIP